MPVNSRSVESYTLKRTWVYRAALILKAKTLLLICNRAAATGVFLELLATWPDDVYSMNSLGYEALQCGDVVQAANYFERVARIAADKSSAHFNLAYVWEKLERFGEAELEFGAAIAIEEKMDRAWYGLGLVYERTGRLNEAVAAFQRTTKLQPMSPAGWYRLAWIHVKLGHVEEVRGVIRHLNEFEPEVAARLGRETGICGYGSAPQNR
jgi:tetratricopeptide (TPR) repeat protein